MGRIELFHTKNGIAFGRAKVDDHVITFAIESERFRMWLKLQWFRNKRSALSDHVAAEVIATISAYAQFESPERTVYRRVAKIRDTYHIDMGDTRCRVIRIHRRGWD